VVATLRALPDLWAQSPEKERAALLRSIYAKVEVRGPEFAGVHLTPDAEELGLALALPESIVLARPAGAGHAIAIVRLPIVGRFAWENAAASA
jgi:hypothetical protein